MRAGFLQERSSALIHLRELRLGEYFRVPFPALGGIDPLVSELAGRAVRMLDSLGINPTRETPTIKEWLIVSEGSSIAQT